MTSTYGRARSTEAPMPGIEFTNRQKTVPAWRSGVDASSSNQNTPMKRTHSAAMPPPSPFDPKRHLDTSSRPVFGENVRYLFNPPPVSQSFWSTPAPDTPEIDMKDVEVTPPAHMPQPNFVSRRKDDVDVLDNEYDAQNENESPERRLISNAAVRRIERARRRGLTRTRSGRSTRTRSRLAETYDEGEVDDSAEDDDEFEDDGSPKKSKSLSRVTQNTSNHYTLNMPGPAPQGGDGPYVLLGYLQFAFNLSLILLFLYLLVQFIFTVQGDVQERVAEYSMEIRQDMAMCAQQYKQNLCASSPIPAMLQQCSKWEMCMNRDPFVVGRAKVGAEMLAEVVNGFVDGISWKTLLFTLSSLAFLTIFVNALISLYRQKHHPDRQVAHSQQPAPAPLPHFPPGFHAPYGYLPASVDGSGSARWPMPQQMAWHPESELETLPRQRRRLENGEPVGVKS